jgi:hypothetical protein
VTDNATTPGYSPAPTDDVALDEESPMDDLLEYAWTIIANAGGGDWTRETPEWQEAAAKFREQYHARLAAL